MSTKLSKRAKITFRNISTWEVWFSLSLEISARRSKTWLLPLILMKSMRSHTWKGQNAYKFKVIPTKPSLIFRDTLLLLLRIKRYISMLGIYFFKTVHMRIASLPSAMELTFRTIMSWSWQRQNATFCLEKMRQRLLFSANTENCHITSNTKAI